MLQILYLYQDELEFGYIDSPHQRFPVVLDSPRDGKLQDFPYKELLVRDTVNAVICTMTQKRLNFLFHKGSYRKRSKFMYELYHAPRALSCSAPSLVSAAPTRMIIKSFVVSSHIISHVSQVKQARMISFLLCVLLCWLAVLIPSPTFNHDDTRQASTCHQKSTRNSRPDIKS